MTSKKPSRIRILMMPYQEDEGSNPAGFSGPATVLTGLPLTIRRHELGLMDPTQSVTNSIHTPISRAFYTTRACIRNQPIYTWGAIGRRHAIELVG